MKFQQAVRKRTRDGAAAMNGQSRSFIILAQVQLYDPYGRNFVTSRLQQTVERHNNAQVIRTDVVEDDDNSSGGGNDNTPMQNLPKFWGYSLRYKSRISCGNATQQGDSLSCDDNR